MAVTLSSVPKIAFSQNEIGVALTSNNYFISSGRAAVYILNWSTNPVNGNFIDIQFDNRVKITIQSVSIPDGSGNQVPIQGSETKTEYALILAESLRKNFLLSSNYIIQESGDTVKLTARKPGGAYAILSTGANFFLTQSLSPINRIIQPNFQHYLEIWKGDELLFESLLPLNYPIDGKTSIDISSIVHASLSLDIPDLNTVWQACDKSIIAYYLRYANGWGDPISINSVLESEEKYAVLGGYSKMALMHIDTDDHLEKYLLADTALYQSQNWFEAYPVDDVEVKTNQPQFLYFINSRDEFENYRIKVEAVLEDNATAEWVLPGGFLNSFEKACIAVGYKQLGLDALSPEGNKIVSYKVQLVAFDDTPRSVQKSFIVNRCYEANTRYFLYAGSDGNFKTLRTYGTAEANADFVSESGTIETSEAKRIQFGDVLTFDVVSFENEVVSTGYIMSRHLHESIKEFILTTRAFRVIGDKLIPIEITTNKMPLPMELNKTGFVKIEYRLAWDERLFTGDTSALNVPTISQSQQALNDI